MKKIVFLFIIAVFSTLNSFSAEKVLIGNFQGYNLYIYNPFDNSGEEFCVTSVTVNDVDAQVVAESNAFVIDLVAMKFKKGDSLNIVINHKDECEPKILNLEDLKPKSTFTITSINVDSEGVLHWNTIAETGRIPYIVEQFRWGKWIELGEVAGIGSEKANEYSFNLNNVENIKPHSKVNQYRVKQITYEGKKRYSLKTKYNAKGAVVTANYDTKAKLISFSAPTSYEIIDEAGELKSVGHGESIDVKSFDKGIYYINFDNDNLKIKKK